MNRYRFVVGHTITLLQMQNMLYYKGWEKDSNTLHGKLHHSLRQLPPPPPYFQKNTYLTLITCYIKPIFYNNAQRFSELVFIFYYKQITIHLTGNASFTKAVSQSGHRKSLIINLTQMMMLRPVAYEHGKMDGMVGHRQLDHL